MTLPNGGHPASTRGDRTAFSQLFSVVYDELHRIAGHHMRRERVDHSLGATALVHEVFVKLSKVEPEACTDQRWLIGAAARAMRCILVDHARKRNTDRRGGNRDRHPLSDAASPDAMGLDELLDLDAAITALSEEEPRQAKVVELKYFAALTDADIAETLDVTLRTIGRDWRAAREWFQKRLGSSDD